MSQKKLLDRFLMEISEISHEFEREKLYIKDQLLHIDLKDQLKIATVAVFDQTCKT